MRILSIDIGARNLAGCDVAWRGVGADVPIIHTWNLYDLCPKIKNVKSIRTEKLVAALIPIFRPLAERAETTYDAVVIERQKNGASKMVSLSHAIQTVFALLSPRTKVVFFSPKFKLHVDDTWVDGTTQSRTAANVREKVYSDTHYQNKRIAIETCAALLTSHQASYAPWMKLWNDNKGKRDDLADAFLQGLAFIKQETDIEFKKAAAAVVKKNPSTKKTKQAKKAKRQPTAAAAKKKSNHPNNFVIDLEEDLEDRS